MQKVIITDYGAKQNTISTQAIQQAFDEASKLAGGVVVIPEGIFLTGTINMGKASLYLEKGAILKGSSNPNDYQDNGFQHSEMRKTYSLLYSMQNSDISISGEGTIDLSGSTFYDYSKREIPDYGVELSAEQIQECTVKYSFRPTQPIFFYQCNHITMEGIRIVDAPCWTLSFNDCENIHITDLTIENNLTIPNNDGMHFCGCRKVFIRGCNIVSGDDCIALSAITNWKIACEDVVISDCILCSSSKAIVLGHMHSIVRNVCISNCIIKDSNRGICIMTSTEAGLIEHVTVTNVRIDTRARVGNWWGNGEPICMLALYCDSSNFLQSAPKRDLKVNINDIQFRNISCSGENMIAILGKDHNIQNVVMDGIYYERKPSKNGYLKGLNAIDIAPSRECIPRIDDAIEYWIQIHACKAVKIHNSVVAKYKEKELNVYMTQCENVTTN